MKGLSLFIHRPVLATVVNVLLILVGLVALSKLTIREYPNIDVPVVSVVTSYSGASAYIMESQVTDVLEESLSGIDGVDYILSKSRLGRSDITVHFVLDRDADAAASDVRDRVARMRSLMPDDIKQPVISKVEADATPFMYLALTSDHRKPTEVNDFAEDYVKDNLQTIAGIAEIRILGARKHAMRIWLDKDKMAALNVIPSDVEKAIRQQNLELPAGLIESVDREFSVYPRTDLQTVAEFENIIIRSDGSYQLRLSDVADVKLGVEDERTFVRYNGETAIGIGIVKQATANPLKVADEVHVRVAKILNTLPKDMRLSVPHDASVFIKGSIDAVWITLIEALVLVLAVIYLFLQSGRATFIPMTAIPVSLIGGFIFMWVMGFSLNTLTLLALVLAIGLVVDDAIVMLENIYRHLESGKTPMQAALDGAKEIAYPVIAMTLTLAAVFAPVAFTEGRTGKLFAEFALTLTGAVLVSGFVALTLSPMLCAKLLQSPQQEKTHQRTWILRVFESMVSGSRDAYLRLLNWLLVHRWFGWLCLGFCLLLSLMLMPIGLGTQSIIAPLNDELSPVEDRGYFFTIAMAPEGSSPEFVSRASKAKEAVYKSMSDVRGYFVVAGYPNSTQGISFVPLKPYDEREKHSSELAMDAMRGFFMIPDIIAYAMPPQSLGSSSSTPISVMIQTSDDYQELLRVGNLLTEKMRANAGINQVRLDLHLNKPELEINIDRQKAADVGIAIDEISRALETLLGGRHVTRFKKANEQYEVIVQMAATQRSTPQHIADVFLRSKSGEMISLSNLVSIKQTTTANELPHFNKFRAAQITAGVNDGYSIGEAVAFMEAELAAISPATKLDYKDSTREYIQSGNTLVFAFVLALLFIYLVLAAQFESFIDPFIIITSVLPAFVGALIALKLSEGSLNIYSKIGLITLVGLITKHGILMVEFANQSVAQGHSKVEAIIAAAQTRYRPILMTASATVLGAMPLALATGPGAETRQEIGWVIVGGLSFGTVLTLIVVPVVYLAFSQKKPVLLTAQ